MQKFLNIAIRRLIFFNSSTDEGGFFTIVDSIEKNIKINRKTAT